MVFESFLLKYCICLIMFCLNLSLHYPSKEGEIAYDGCDGGVSEELDRGLDFVNFVYLIFWHCLDKKFDVYHIFPIICSGKHIIIVPPAPELGQKSVYKSKAYQFGDFYADHILLSPPKSGVFSKLLVKNRQKYVELASLNGSVLVK